MGFEGESLPLSVSLLSSNLTILYLIIYPSHLLLIPSFFSSFIFSLLPSSIPIISISIVLILPSHYFYAYSSLFISLHTPQVYLYFPQCHLLLSSNVLLFFSHILIITFYLSFQSPPCIVIPILLLTQLHVPPSLPPQPAHTLPLPTPDARLPTKESKSFLSHLSPLISPICLPWSCGFFYISGVWLAGALPFILSTYLSIVLLFVPFCLVFIDVPV